MEKKFQNRQNKQKKVAIPLHASFSGPLPPPEMLARYDEIIPGSAERILTMAESQSLHRRELEREVVFSRIALSRRGQWLGFAIAIVGLGTSAIIAIYGSALAGGIIGLGTLVSLVGVFMYGTKVQHAENK